MTETDQPKLEINRPELWSAHIPVLKTDGHKYDRGHCVVLSGGPCYTGAARLAAGAALRAGSGLVTLYSPPNAVLVNAAHLTAVMIRSIAGPEAAANALGDKRITAVVAGPGLGTGEKTCLMVEAILSGNQSVVLDADALTSFRDQPTRLYSAIQKRTAPVILTPHMGEYCALFGGRSAITAKERFNAALAAAATSGAHVVLKGAGTLVASPADATGVQRISGCDSAPKWLATAGSGDVLAGIIGGLLAREMPAFEAASCAVWLHGEAANHSGPALISEDLDAGLKTAIGNLVKKLPG